MSSKSCNPSQIQTQTLTQQPWGRPSSPITISSLPSGALIAFISRHGTTHHITPTEVPARANIAALKHIGCQAIIAFSAVGSLREEIAPGHFVIPDQIIDRTKGIRADTFFRGEGLVAHSMFGDPFSNQLNTFVEPLVRDILKKEGGVELHTGKTVVCMEGMFRLLLRCPGPGELGWWGGKGGGGGIQGCRRLGTVVKMSSHALLGDDGAALRTSSCEQRIWREKLLRSSWDDSALLTSARKQDRCLIKGRYYVALNDPTCARTDIADMPRSRLFHPRRVPHVPSMGRRHHQHVGHPRVQACS